VKSISEFKNAELVWSQPRALDRAYELRSGAEILGTLQWKSGFGSLADATAAEGQWTFKRMGFFNPRITARAPGSESNLAVFTPNWKSEGPLEFASGQAFGWMAVGFWRAQWAFGKANGEHLVDFEPHASFLKKSAVVKIAPDAFSLPELSLLILMGWYLILLRSDDDASAATAFSVVT